MDLKSFLEDKLLQYNNQNFIEKDPISIPHRYTKKQDIEIAGFLAATLAWGRRDIILKKCHILMELMNNTPHEFILNLTNKDLQKISSFKHRTFNSDDLKYFLQFLQKYYRENQSLENLFSSQLTQNDDSIEKGLIEFHKNFFSSDKIPPTTFRHISTPQKKSACKRLSMFLRWMVRKDYNKVDFGIWHNISPAQLVVPCDVHVHRVSKKLGLTTKNNLNWQTCLEITKALKTLDPDDPIKYDFALFSIGVENEELLF
jgi:uncharacterized protein (TIGR02757 family)